MSSNVNQPQDLERRRVSELQSYQLDTSATPEFDQLTDLASRIFDVPIALISLVDDKRQFFKSRVGLAVSETPRDISFCAHAIAPETTGPLLVPDALSDARFVDNPLVTGPPHIRSYFGYPLVSANGFKLGTLCIIDTKARHDFGEKEVALLQNLANVVTDKLELWRLNHLHHVGQTQWQNIATTSPDAIICTNLSDLINFWNDAAAQLFGYSQEEILNTSIKRLTDESGLALFRQLKEQFLASDSLFERNLHVTAKRKDGSTFPAELSFSTWLEEGGRSIGLIVRDTTERRKNYAKLKRLALTDALTGLANRSAWKRIAEAQLNDAVPVTILLADLDGFKEINDTLGHAAGDELLKVVAKRIKRAAGKPITIARLGGDEFALLFCDIEIDQATAIAASLIADVAQPHIINDHPVAVGMSIGIAQSPAHGAQLEELLNASDLALYQAKSEGKNRCEIFKPAFKEVANQQRALRKELRQAIMQQEFVLYFQPQISLATGQLVGAEALLRWQHPTLGIVQPIQFIELLNKKQAVMSVGDWILDEACQRAKQWQAYIPEFRIGINLFDVQLSSKAFPGVVAKALNKHQLSPASLELEIVETTFLQKELDTVARLNTLRELGVLLAFDDYGTGFAALNLLKTYPVSRLKIDKTFMHDVTADKGNAALVKAIIYLGKSFGLSIIAEGVENPDQQAFLQHYGCDEAQGYYYGEPVSADEFLHRFVKAQVNETN